MGHTPAEAGKSSFDLIDSARLFSALPLASARSLLDLGCGEGRYTLPLARAAAPTCAVHGIDLWAEGVARLQRAAAEAGLTRVTAAVGDLCALEALADASVDLALMATVLHDLVARGNAAAPLGEAARVLRSGGTLALVEFHRRESKPGPPLAIRLAPEQVAARVEPAGFRQQRVVELGEALYLALFERTAASAS